MKVTLKSNRNFLYWFVVPTLIMNTVFGTITFVEYLKNHNIILLLLSIAAPIVTGVFLTFLFILIFKKKPEYNFTENAVSFKYKRETKILKLEEIENMTFYKMKWFEFFLAPLDVMPWSKCNRIIITNKNGNKFKLGFIIPEDAQKLEKLYPNLLKFR